MKKIILSSFYYISKSGLFIKILIVFMLLTFAAVFSTIVKMEQNSIEQFVYGIDTLTMFNMIVIIFFVSLNIGSEFKNKTMYYLVMNGNTRREIFVGKIIGIIPHLLFLGLIQSVIMFMLLYFMIGPDFINNEIKFYILKSISCIIIYLSFAIASISLTFSSRSIVGGIGGGLIYLLVSNMFFILLTKFPFNIFSHNISDYFGMFVFRNIFSENNNPLFLYIVSLLYIFLSVLYVKAGYSKFKNDDLI